MNDEPRHFLSDFGLVFVKNTIMFKALLDMDDELMNLYDVSSKNDMYQLTFATNDIALKVGDVVTQGSTAYKVREPSRKVSDGVFSTAILTKI